MSARALTMAAGGASAPAVYVEDVFSTYLYTGNGSTQTITNGIDLAGKGGLVWNQSRSNSYGGYIYDTARGTNKRLQPLSTSAQFTATQDVTAFNSNGFTMGTEVGINGGSGQTYASWTFRNQPKFFDVVTYTGNGASTQTIAHSLGSTPGCIIIKKTSDTSVWSVYHRSLTAGSYLRLNGTFAQSADSFMDGANAPTSTTFTAQLATSDGLNANGATYVAYLFAHNAGGFGLTGTDNVISCGSFTTNGSAVSGQIELGWEPQWLLIKCRSATGNWMLVDNMRGVTATGNGATGLYANTSGAEDPSRSVNINATGFSVTGDFGISATSIYIAIRRGPMKVPTSGTSVFSPVAYAGTGSATTTTTGFVTDLAIIKSKGTYSPSFEDRLRGANKVLESSGTGAEVTTTQYVLGFDTQSGVRIGNDAGVNASGTNYIDWAFRRAPSFFDEVCYTGNDTLRTINHNLGVAPEMMIIKVRDTALGWAVYHSGIGNTKYLFLNTTAAAVTDSAYWNNTSPTASVFTVNTSNKVNSSPSPYVAYLFATCAGVSKVGSYTGNGSSQTIACGFAAGARFVMIKRTDSTGDWYVWDSARGIVSGNDPYLPLNASNAEVTSTDYIDTYSAGFEITSTAPAAINASGGSFIFLAIA